MSIWIGLLLLTARAEEPPAFEQHATVMLITPDSAPEQTEEAAAELGKQHRAHLTKLTEGGQIHVCGPFSGQPDEKVRGVCVYAVPVEQARELAEQDPAVKAGQLRVDVMTWWTPAGRVAFPASAKP